MSLSQEDIEALMNGEEIFDDLLTLFGDIDEDTKPSKLLKIVEDKLTSTLDEMLIKDTKIIDIKKIDKNDLISISAVYIKSALEAENKTQELEFIIPTYSASYIFNTMIGDDSEPADKLDDDIVDANTEFISYLLGTITTEINNLLVEPAIKFTTVNTDSYNHDNLMQTEDIYKFHMDLEGTDIIIYILFSELYSSIIEVMLNNEVLLDEKIEKVEENKEEVADDDTPIQNTKITIKIHSDTPYPLNYDLYKNEVAYMKELSLQHIIKVLEYEEPKYMALVFMFLEKKQSLEIFKKLPYEIKVKIIIYIAKGFMIDESIIFITLKAFKNLLLDTEEYDEFLEEQLEKKKINSVTIYDKTIAPYILNNIGCEAQDILENLYNLGYIELHCMIEENMLIFDDIFTIFEINDLMRIIGNIETNDLVIVLKNKSIKYKEKIELAMSQRAKERFNEEFDLTSEYLDENNIKDSEDKILRVVRELLEYGEIERVVN